MDRYLSEERSFAMQRVIFSVLLGLLALGAFFTSVTLAAPSQPVIPPAEPDILFQDTITPTTEITSTGTTTHPVAAAMAEFFDVPYSEIWNLHEVEGYGFGVIAHAYFAAQKLGILPGELLDKFDSGMGWGQILKDYGLHPGRAGRGGNLGDVMSGHKKGQSLDSAGSMPPGQMKKGNGQSGDEGNSKGEQGQGKGHNK
jgi:hypothetical protein